MPYKGARGAVPTRGRGDEYAHGIDSDWTGSGGGQYTRDTFLTRQLGELNAIMRFLPQISSFWRIECT